MPSTSLTGPILRGNLVGKSTPAPQRGATNLILLTYIPNHSLISDECLSLLMLYRSTMTSTFGECKFPESVKPAVVVWQQEVTLGGGQCSNSNHLQQT